MTCNALRPTTSHRMFSKCVAAQQLSIYRLLHHVCACRQGGVPGHGETLTGTTGFVKFLPFERQDKSVLISAGHAEFSRRILAW